MEGEAQVNVWIVSPMQQLSSEYEETLHNIVQYALYEMSWSWFPVPYIVLGLKRAL